MYDHRLDPRNNYTRASVILDDVHHIVLADILIEGFVFLFAGVCNLCLLTIEGRHWIKSGTISLPRLLIFWLACVDAVGVILGLLPKFFVLAVKPCPELMFEVVHMLIVTFHVFAILMSKLTVVLMGIERYTSILKPFFYVRACTMRKFFIAEIAFITYSAIFAGVSSFFNYYHYHDTHVFYEDLDEENCHETFLIFEFGSINHNIDFPWRYGEICGSFQLYQLVQDILLLLILVVCNMAVIRALKVMDQRMKQVCPMPGASSSPQSTTNYPGRDFSCLMTLINVSVLLLTTPQMVIRLTYTYAKFNSQAIAYY